MSACVWSGEHRHSDLVVIRFPDQATIDGWYDSTTQGAPDSLPIPTDFLFSCVRPGKLS